MVWTSLDASVLLIYIVFVYWQPIMQSPMNTMNKSWYDKNRKRLACSVPGYLFGIVWIVLFGLISTSGFLYLGQPDSADSIYFLSAFVVFAVNVVLTKIWYPIFFDKSTKRIGLALLIATLISMTAIVFVVLLTVDKAYVAMGLYIPYVLWSFYAVFLNYRFWTFVPKDAVSSSGSKKGGSEKNTSYSRVARSSHLMRERSTVKKKKRKDHTTTKLSTPSATNTEERRLDIVL